MSRSLTGAWDQMRIHVSSPPSTVLHVRGGWMQASIYWLDQNTVWLPPADLDLSSLDDLRLDANHVYDGFTEPLAYKPILLCWNGDYFWYLATGSATSYPSYGKRFAIPMSAVPEYGTAVEAEQGISAWLDADTSFMRYLDMPLAVVVLRNDGQTGVPGAVQAVDAVNRGRSYLWRDVRVRHRTEYYDGFYD